MTHPLVLALLIVGIAVGLFGTAKQDILSPVFGYAFVVFLTRGGKYRPLWTAAAVTALFYILLVYPYSQYVRAAGGREGTLSERVEATSDIRFSMLADHEDRRTVVQKERETVASSAATGKLRERRPHSL